MPNKFLDNFDREFDEKILRIIARVIGTSLQTDVLSGKYADDFEKYREEIKSFFRSQIEKETKKGESWRRGYLQGIEEQKEKCLESLKLWRPYFYRDKITEEDIEEIKEILK